MGARILPRHDPSKRFHRIGCRPWAWQAWLHVPLCVEYEGACSRAEHVEAAGFDPADLPVFLDAVLELVEPVEAWFLWRPQLRDYGDELVLEAAVNGRAAAIATFNRRDFLPGATRFGVDVLLPGEALRRIAA